MANPFGEGTYPSPMQGLQRGYEAFLADQARRHGEEGNQRQQMMMFAARMILDRREEEEQRTYQEAQEAQQRAYREEQAEVKFGRQKTIAELASGRRLEEIEARGTQARKTALAREKARRKTELAKVKNTEDKTFLQSYWKIVDDLNQTETQIGKHRYRKPPPDLIFKKQQFENQIYQMKGRVDQILGLGTKQPSGVTLQGQPMMQPTAEQAGFTMTTPDGEILSREPDLVAWLVLQGKSQKEINAAVKDWRSRGGR